ncbi:HlyD family efflux transporter periplasmic adaptor subunit [Lacihabitans sp. LS3-19]|uniref:HlyD family secretion protein n=1 Tax=Lacihabitans sp. LS3-19 TaxID=2487335 RepID=UPI0020CCE98E|nr:HlyD family efflux transporter periplasmic adaptor subunit [Lacihabitans sp. LS3-19]MCP9767937.1 HlyD family efflux transporter periplasmic adaptor subunit [Lacihabitans sp. LS3-19]
MNNLLKKSLDGDSGLEEKYDSLNHLYHIDKKSKIRKWFLGISIGAAIVLFLPWTQNIRAKGKVTTLNQQYRPQALNTLLPGKIVKWYASEGDFVKKGDTIIQLSEVKTEYLDPFLTENYGKQIEAKTLSSEGYLNKAKTSEIQISALKEGLRLKISANSNKIEQQLLKISSDSLDLVAEENALNAYSRQIEAAKTMLDQGALSMVEFEKRRVNFQNSKAKVNSVSNKLNQSKQELLNLKIERNSIFQDYQEKISKADGDRFSSISAARSTEAEISKLKNQMASYAVRQGMLFILAPQDGQIVKTKKAGIGEVLKEADVIAEVVPEMPDKAVELYIQPMDLPLLSLGQNIRFVFDGFPAIVFSGWPNSSYGTFGGKVTYIETSANESGLFRVLVAPDEKWPDMLKIGGGANGIALLKDVPIYFELWRNINGFPPEYYQFKKDEKTK